MKDTLRLVVLVALVIALIGQMLVNRIQSRLIDTYDKVLGIKNDLIEVQQKQIDGQQGQIDESIKCTSLIDPKLKGGEIRIISGPGGPTSGNGGSIRVEGVDR